MLKNYEATLDHGQVKWLAHTHQLKRNKVKYLQYMHDIIRFIYLYMMIRNGYFLKGCSSIAICSDR